jgi:hypothetical protein
MYIKLQYSSNKRYAQCLRLLTAIVQDATITSAEILETKVSTWHADVKGGIDFINSEIIRTVDPTNVRMRYNKSTNFAYLNNHNWMVEFDVYDNPGEKWYIQSRSELTTGVVEGKWSVGTVLAGGAFDAPGQQPPTQTDATAPGSSEALFRLDPANNVENKHATALNGPDTGDIRCMWVHLTNEGLALSFTHRDSTNNGMPTDYTNLVSSATISGPYIFGHYERWDYWNKASNGIVPVMYHNIHRQAHCGYGFDLARANYDWAQTLNTEYNVPTNDAGPYRIFGTIDAKASTSPSWPLQRHTMVNQSVGMRSDYYLPLTTTGLGAVATSAIASTGAVVHMAASTRYISEDLKSTTFGMLPITWQHAYYNNTGGSMTARTGVYLFNGEYFPGDEYTFNSKNYVIWPTYSGYAQRVGIAIPKE